MPDFSIEHMAEVFEWPPSTGKSWEAQEGISSMIDTASLDPVAQVESFHASMGEAFWMPVPQDLLMREPQ